MRTDLCDLIGIDLPIIQAPMGSASCPALAAAVSNAGGLGTLALSWTKPNDVRQIIRATRNLTQRPFGINLVLDWPQEERLAICLEEKVRVISFFFGDALPFVERIHAAGSLVCVTVGSAEEARAAAAGGVDFIVAQGWEAGGHVSGQVCHDPSRSRGRVRSSADASGCRWWDRRWTGTGRRACSWRVGGLDRNPVLGERGGGNSSPLPGNHIFVQRDRDSFHGTV